MERAESSQESLPLCSCTQEATGSGAILNKRLSRSTWCCSNASRTVVRRLERSKSLSTTGPNGAPHTSPNALLDQNPCTSDSTKLHTTHLVLLKVIAHDGQAAGAKEVVVHELPRGLEVAAQADADERQVATGREEIAALQESRHLDLSHHRQACRAARHIQSSTQRSYGVCIQEK